MMLWYQIKNGLLLTRHPKKWKSDGRADGWEDRRTDSQMDEDDEPYPNLLYPMKYIKTNGNSFFYH